MARNRGAAVAAPTSGDAVATQRMRIPTNGPHDGDTLSPEITPAPGTVDFGAVRVPVPAGGTVSVEPSTAGRIQAVHVTVPEGRLSVSALAAPRTGGLWADLAIEIDASLREGGARVRSFTGEWGRELHATTGGATSVFVGVDGPRWMLYGVATGPTRDAVGLDARLRRMLRGTVVVRGKAPFPVRTVLPLVTPSETGEEQAEAAAPPTMTLRAPAAAAMGAAPKALIADPAAPVNGATNGAVNGSGAEDAGTGVFRRNGVSRTGGTRRNGSTTGATRKDVPPRGASTTGGSRAATPPRGRSGVNGTGASVPFPPTNGARPAGRSAGTTGANPLGAPRPGGTTSAHPLGTTGANPPGAGRPGGTTGAHPLGNTGTNPAGDARAGGPGEHPLGTTRANPPGAGRPGGTTGAHPLGTNGVNPPTASRPGGTTGAHPLGNTGADPAGAARAGEHPLGTTGANPPGGAFADRPEGRPAAHPLGLDGAGRAPDATRLGPAAADFAGDSLGGDPVPNGATWSCAHPFTSPGFAPGASPEHHSVPGEPALPWSPGPHGTPAHPNRSFPAAGPAPSGATGAQPAPDAAPWSARYDASDSPLGPPPFSARSSRSEVPPAWAHRFGQEHARSSFDDVGGRPEPTTPPRETYGGGWQGRPASDPSSNGRHPRTDPDRGAGWDPLSDPLPMALDPLPAPSPTWTESRHDTAADDRPAPPRSRDGAAAPTNGAAARWRAADLLRDRGDGSSERWRAADLLSGRGKPEPASPGTGKWLAADLLADRGGSHEAGSSPHHSRPPSRRTDVVDPAPPSHRGDGAAPHRRVNAYDDSTAAGRRTDHRDDAAAGLRGSDSAEPSRHGPRADAAQATRRPERDAAAPIWRGHSDDTGARGRGDDDHSAGGRGDDDLAAGGRSDDGYVVGGRRDDLAAGSRGYDGYVASGRGDDGYAAGGRRDDDLAAGGRGYDGYAASGRGDDGYAAGGRRDDDLAAGGRGYDGYTASGRGDDGYVAGGHGYDDLAAGSRGDDGYVAGGRGYDGYVAGGRGYDGYAMSGRGDDGYAAGGRRDDDYAVSAPGAGDYPANGRGSEAGAGGRESDGSRWLAAELLDGAPSHADGRARRRREAEAAAEPHVNGYVGGHDGNGAVPRWRAAELLANGHSDVSAAVDHSGRAHDRVDPRTSTWQAAELLDDSARRPAEATGDRWRAADLLDRSNGSDDGSGRRRAPDARTAGRIEAPHRHGDDGRPADPPSRVPPTQWAWPKEPDAAPDPVPSRRGDTGGRSAWAAADLLDEGRHAGGRRRARESTRHGAPDDDAGRHLRS